MIQAVVGRTFSPTMSAVFMALPTGKFAFPMLQLGDLAGAKPPAAVFGHVLVAKLGW